MITLTGSSGGSLNTELMTQNSWSPYYVPGTLTQLASGPCGNFSQAGASPCGSPGLYS